jgi:large subunit ribosomal protein L24e
MRIEKCSFCGAPIYPGHGQMFVRNDCKIFRFCASKCRKNFGMKRNPMKLKWTKTFRKAHNKELTNDTVLEFEQRRHVPVKYNRELVGTTLQVMKRAAEIKTRREKDHWKARMRTVQRQEAKDAVKALTYNIDWVDDAQVKETAKEDLAKIKGLMAESRARKRETMKQKNRKLRAKQAEDGGNAAEAAADE